MDKTRKLVLAALVATFLTFLFPATNAYAERDTVKIGFFESDKYGFVNAEGTAEVLRRCDSALYEAKAIGAE